MSRTLPDVEMTPHDPQPALKEVEEKGETAKDVEGANEVAPEFPIRTVQTEEGEAFDDPTGELRGEILF